LSVDVQPSIALEMFDFLKSSYTFAALNLLH
jgi:hypothetical protein